VAMVLTAVCAFMVVLWILNSVFFDLKPQSRYLFVAVAAPATAMAWAGSYIVHRLASRSRVVVAIAVICATILLGIDSLRVAVLRTP
jgi:preprotein translocase subunit SecE